MQYACACILYVFCAGSYMLHYNYHQARSHQFGSDTVDLLVHANFKNEYSLPNYTYDGRHARGKHQTATPTIRKIEYMRVETMLLGILHNLPNYNNE